MNHGLVGIQQEYAYQGGVHEFKLSGLPFAPNSSSSVAISSRRMAGCILQRLHQQGCKLLISCGLTRTTDLTSWIFKKVPVNPLPCPPFLVVGLSSTDSLMILNAPTQLHQLFRDVIQKSWPAGIPKLVVQ